jgi:hypothetical protein
MAALLADLRNNPRLLLERLERMPAFVVSMLLFVIFVAGLRSSRNTFTHLLRTQVEQIERLGRFVCRLRCAYFGFHAQQ